MKKNPKLPYLAAIVFAVIAISPLFEQSVYAQTQNVLSAPFGYGANATGGAGGQVKVVATRTELDNALNASESAIILVKGTLNFGEEQMIRRVVANKTIIGLPGAKLLSDAQTANGGILQLSANSNNVIIRNLVFEGPGAYDVDGRDLLFVRGTNIWVDHCEFYDGVDGNFDISNEADNITATWNKFGYNKPAKAGGSGGSNDHRFSNLISGGDGTAPADGRYSVTLAYNWWGNGVRERMPRARNAELHLLNNYVNSNVGARAIGLSAGINGTDVYVESCHFKAVATVLDVSYGGSPRVTIVGSDRSNGNTNGGASKPTYSYTAIPWESVEAAVTGPCGAGATLQVNETTGAVSCGDSGISPIIFANHSLLTTYHSLKYYDLTGQVLGNAQPDKSGIYIVKNSKTGKTYKIAVK